MEYCVNCKHLDHSTLSCAKSSTISLVTGKALYSSAYLYRQDEHYCGKDGKWFEFIETEDLDDLSAIPFGK